AGHEPAPGTAQDQNTDVRIGGHLPDRVTEGFRHCLIQRIQRRRAGKRDLCNGALHLIQQRAVFTAHLVSCFLLVSCGKAACNMASMKSWAGMRPSGLYQRTMWFIPPSTNFRSTTASPLSWPASTASEMARCHKPS